MDTKELSNLHIKYMKELLVPEILSKFEDEQLQDVRIDSSSGLDGFMSALYNITLKTTKKGSTPISKEHMIIVKFMRGDDAFRESSKSYIQFANEIFVYDKLLPAYEELLKRAKINDVSVEDWAPHCYAAKFGYIKGLSSHSSARESVLALQNLKSQGYTMGPRLYLDCDQLLVMAKTLGQYHSMSYALRQDNHINFNELHKQIVPLPFVDDAGSGEGKSTLYGVIYRIAFDRFFDYYDRLKQHNSFDTNNPGDVQLLENVERLRQRYFKEPTHLLEYLRTNIESTEEDRHWGVILHGDFNRNNVMFHYEIPQNQGQKDDTTRGRLVDIKLIDFQELRYGSPAIDLSFYMFFNTPENLRCEIWMDILKTYHDEMIKTLEKTIRGINSSIAEADISKILENYSFENFIRHFSRYAFYGVIICLHFLPWLLCSEEECIKLSKYFESDMHGDEFYNISMSAGGDDTNKSILDVVRFASEMGYMNNL